MHERDERFQTRQKLSGKLRAVFWNFGAHLPILNRVHGRPELYRHMRTFLYSEMCCQSEKVSNEHPVGIDIRLGRVVHLPWIGHAPLDDLGRLVEQHQAALHGWGPERLETVEDVHDACQTEVSDLGIKVPVEEYVQRLQVPVNQTRRLVVQTDHRRRNLLEPLDSADKVQEEVLVLFAPHDIVE